MNNKKKTILTLLALIITVLTGCRDNAHVNEIFQQADSLMADHPDSAYTMLLAMESEVQACPKGQQMRYELLRAKAQNKAFVDFTTDSIMLLVADYYDHHGTPNDRLMAHYLLGCTYRDLGEAPRAIDSYQTALECADTTDSECDYRTLSSVHSQMAEINHEQKLYVNETKFRQNAFMYAVKSKDFKRAAYELCMIGCSYILQNQPNIAENYFLDAKNLYEEYGFHQEWIERSCMLIHLYLENTNELQKAEKLIKTYEQKSKCFGMKGELPYNKQKFYLYKAIAFEKRNQLDSAEYYCRKFCSPKMTPTEEVVIYRGLLHVYQHQHNADSIAKYAQLYCEANDSSIAITDREITAKMTASYNYNRYLKEANIQQAKAARTTNWLVFSIAITLFVIIGALYLYHRYRQRKAELKRLLLEYANVREEYGKTRHTLEEEIASHKQIHDFLEDELKKANKETNTYQKHSTELRNKLEAITIHHEHVVKDHKEKIASLESKISDLIRHGAIRQIEERARAFKDTPIAHRMASIAHDPRIEVTEEEWKQLTITAEEFYPELLHDLHSNPNISTHATRVAILIILELHTGEIGNMMHVKNSRISNIKTELNQLLFQYKGASTLTKHMAQRYNIYT